MNAYDHTKILDLEEQVSYHREEEAYWWEMLRHHAKEAYECQKKVTHHREEALRLLNEEVI